MKRTLALCVAGVALAVACAGQASSPAVPDVVTTAPPLPTSPSSAPLSLPPATFPDQSFGAAGSPSLPPLVQPGNNPVGSP